VRTIMSRLISWPSQVRRPAGSTDLATIDLTYDYVRDQVAERLYRQSLHRGGGALDLGQFGPGLFRDEAVACLSEIALGNIQGELPTP
jgi:hypothetical protein